MSKKTSSSYPLYTSFSFSAVLRPSCVDFDGASANDLLSLAIRSFLALFGVDAYPQIRLCLMQPDSRVTSIAVSAGNSPHTWTNSVF